MKITEPASHRGEAAEKRLANDVAKILTMPMPWKDELVAVVVESTFNWYGLVDGLQAVGFTLQLANTAAIKKYEGANIAGMKPTPAI